MSLPRLLFSSSFSNSFFSCSLLASFFFISLIVKSFRLLLRQYITCIKVITKRVNTSNTTNTDVTVAPHEAQILQSKTEYYKHVNTSQGSANIYERLKILDFTETLLKG